MNKNSILLSFIIVNHNNSVLTAECIFSIDQHLSEEFDLEVFLVDNGSDKKDIEKLSSYSFPSYVSILYSDENIGFGAGNNLANNKVSGDYIIYLNNDTLIIDDSIKHGIELLNSNDDIGMVGGKLLHADHSPNVSYGSFPLFITCLTELFEQVPLRCFKQSMATVPPADIYNPIDIDFPCGAFIMLKLSDFKKLNGFDERYFMYFEETDMAFRLKNRYKKRIVYNPDIQIIHKTGSTVSLNKSLNKKQFYISWKLFILNFRNTFWLKVIKTILIIRYLKNMLINLIKFKHADVSSCYYEIKYIAKYL
jgi:GT2 family glycosyltransferase